MFGVVTWGWMGEGRWGRVGVGKLDVYRFVLQEIPMLIVRDIAKLVRYALCVSYLSIDVLVGMSIYPSVYVALLYEISHFNGEGAVDVASFVDGVRKLEGGHVMGNHDFLCCVAFGSRFFDEHATSLVFFVECGGGEKAAAIADFIEIGDVMFGDVCLVVGDMRPKG